MTLTRIIASAAAALLSSALTLSGQTLSGPAELPPASFNGTQYIDSRGCVFVRAGIDGAVNWVPRVNQQRVPICGQTPTLQAAAEARRALEEQAASPPATEQNAPATTTATTPQAAPAPQRTATTTARRPAATTRTTSAPPAQELRTPQRPEGRIITRPAVVTAPPPPDVVIPSPGVRRVPLGEVVAAPRLAQTRVRPRHVDDTLREQDDAFQVPEGYRPVWDDDRLNPRRAEQSLEGIARTRLIWTQTVPRRLIDQYTGDDVTARVPLVYPYTDQSTQRRELGTVTLIRRDGQVLKKIERNRSKRAVRTEAVQSATAPPRAKPAPTASGATSGQFVQVGTFGVPANAQAAAQSIARSGLPARIGRVRRGGKSYQVVLAGPFGDPEALKGGLRQARALGFDDAFVRR